MICADWFIVKTENGDLVHSYTKIKVFESCNSK